MSFRWRGEAKGREVFLNLAQTAELPRIVRKSVKQSGKKSVRRKGKERAGVNWIWPAIGFLVFVEVILLGGHAVQWAKSSRHFELSKVEVMGTQTLRAEDIRKLVGIEQGTNIFDADLAAVRARVGSHPWIKRASVRMRPPHFLQVDILERKPAALIMGDQALVVDEDGVVLGRPLAPLAGCLPMVEGFDSRRWRPGDVVRDPRLARSIEAVVLFQGFSVMRSECISVRNTGSGQLRLRALEGKVELIVSEEGMESQAGWFRAVAGDVLRQEKYGAGRLQFDLRFPGRVIVRPLKKDGGTTG
ncbi:MAG: FtsQ-type POTRA domain-containing protein [Nitrospinae bacterium]|nr:FtsQ-type POTRA domain-containing protein [Nitrospinota bacterium]